MPPTASPGGHSLSWGLAEQAVLSFVFLGGWAGRKIPLLGSLRRGSRGMAGLPGEIDQSGQKPPECPTPSCMVLAVRMEEVPLERDTDGLPLPLLGPSLAGVLALCASRMAVAEVDSGATDPGSAGRGFPGTGWLRAAPPPPRHYAPAVRGLGQQLQRVQSQAASSPGARRGHIWFPLLPRAHNKTHGPLGTTCRLFLAPSPFFSPLASP